MESIKDTKAKPCIMYNRPWLIFKISAAIPWLRTTKFLAEYPKWHHVKGSFVCR